MAPEMTRVRHRISASEREQLILTIGDFQLSFDLAERREKVEFNSRFRTETVLKLSVAFPELSEMLIESFLIRLRFAIFQCLEKRKS